MSVSGHVGVLEYKELVVYTVALVHVDRFVYYSVLVIHVESSRYFIGLLTTALTWYAAITVCSSPSSIALALSRLIAVPSNRMTAAGTHGWCPMICMCMCVCIYVFVYNSLCFCMGHTVSRQC